MPAVVITNWLDINDISAGTQTNDIKIAFGSGVSLPIGNNKLGKIIITDGTNDVTLIDDSGTYRLAVQGKFSFQPPAPPISSTSKTIDASSPLDVNGTHNTDYVITDDTTFTIQQITAGAEGDPTEKGTKIEVSYIDTSSASHIIERMYLVGESIQLFPETSTARDGTSLDGTTAGGTGIIRVARQQFGGGQREIDVVVRGFEQ